MFKDTQKDAFKKKGKETKKKVWLRCILSLDVIAEDEWPFWRATRSKIIDLRADWDTELSSFSNLFDISAYFKGNTPQTKKKREILKGNRSGCSSKRWLILRENTNLNKKKKKRHHCFLPVRCKANKYRLLI